jgi:putative aldouronate transport system permease protein
MIEILRNAVDIPNVSNIELPSESFKMSMTIVTIGPIMLLYPYLQKYFIKGIMVGAVKG